MHALLQTTNVTVGDLLNLRQGNMLGHNVSSDYDSMYKIEKMRVLLHHFN